MHLAEKGEIFVKIFTNLMIKPEYHQYIFVIITKITVLFNH
ncbi:hypothetical protein A1OE_1013 [Candidatus Endolissoclinum faulkneri L2]|uniref:Uncharacterized protein n=1 Tax=Candidatus Endolissoclinum faulkneri L2 TaxID=1193729 RepID=K7YNS0_9PROT|nr:hypothetical protein A1OE_1013 [Candidatus Endolissoclinum faulkneri L2]